MVIINVKTARLALERAVEELERANEREFELRALIKFMRRYCERLSMGVGTRGRP